jgi:hypothetical protein
MTLFEYIRWRILNKETFEGRKDSEWSYEFERLMRNRLIVGSYRYGSLRRKRPKGISGFHIKYIKDKLKKYALTGNTELLVDIANLALVEFVTGDHKNKHFKSEERHHD